MNKLAASLHSPGRMTVLAALIAGLSAPALADSPIVISQVYGGGGNSGAQYKHDFIELFNRSGKTVTIGGWSVQYASTGGTSWAVNAITPGVKLAPGKYYLLRQAAGAGTQTDTPYDQAPATGGFSMSANNGKVALVSNTTPLSGTNPSGGALLDLVGFGTANGYETAATPGLANTTAALRKASGCEDTDNNANDFTIGAPTPRTGATPAITPCVPLEEDPETPPPPPAEPIVATCPVSMNRAYGEQGEANLSAIDADSRVTGAVISSASVGGIRLENFVGSSAVNSAATVKLVADASAPAGNHTVVVNFTNDGSQSKTCSVTVRSGDSSRIPAIQGTTGTSPVVGTLQTTEGVITAKVSSGFFIQDAAGDGNPQTSDGLYVFTATTAPVGSLVRVTGLVTEYKPVAAGDSYTELTNAAITVLGTGPTILPANLRIPQADLEPYEAMLVEVTNTLTVNDNKFLGTRGELVLADGRRESPLNRYRVGTPEATALIAANAVNQLVLDDGIFTTPPTVPYLGEDHTVRAGDTVTNLVGVLDFGAAGSGDAVFKLQPTAAPVFSRSNPRPAAPQLPAGVKVASANVLNFFTTFTDGGDAWGATGQGCVIGNKAPDKGECRGADNMAEFERQRDKIVASLIALDADVVGLMEIQNNGDIATQYLVDQINGKLQHTTYAVVANAPAAGTDAIRVAMIYKPAVVSPVGGPMADGHGINNRAPLAQTFKAGNGAKFSVVVNHFKSKTGCSGATAGDRDTGIGQGCWDTMRVNQATQLADYFLPLVTSTAQDPDVLVIGDLNAYGYENPINLLTSKGLVNQIERFIRPEGTPYSYVFDGQAGYLDHALASASLSAQVAGAAEWHNNADEPEGIDYNLEATGTDPYREGAYRASDHDPVVVSLALTPTFADITGSVKMVLGGFSINRVTGKYSGNVTITNTSGKPLTGPLQFLLQGLPAGVTLDNKSGTQKGAPYITLGNSSIAAGASVTVGTTFTNPSKTSFTYTPKLFNGTF